MRKLSLILFGAIAAVASIGVGQGCGDSTTNTGGSGPGGSAGGNAGGSNAGGATTQGNGGSSNNGGSSATVNPTSSGGSSPGTGGSTPGTGGSGGASSACSGDTPVALTVHNVDAWCSVSVNGATASTASTQTVCVAASAAVPLSAAKTPGFTLSDSMWHHVDDSTGDTGVKGDQTSMQGFSLETKTVGASGTACAWVCCPGSNDPTECDVGGAYVPSDLCP